MYNLVIALAAAAGAFALGWAVAGTWVAGFVPALLALVVAYILLARRIGRKVEEIVKRASREFEQGRVENGRRALTDALRYDRWQFLVGAQIHAQLGALDYVQKNWKEARAHLRRAWSRNWMAQGMLAALDHREGKSEAALKRLEKASGPGSKEACFWGLYAWVHLEAEQRDLALKVLDRGLQKLPDSPALKGMADAVRNHRKVKMKAFAPLWYQFFPEQVPRSMLMAAAQQRPGYSYPQPRR